jgi:hypothetical protein
MKLCATKVTPFELVFGQEAMLPVEVNLQGYQITVQDQLSAEKYSELMMDRLDETHESQSMALKEIEKEKLWAARAYNKAVKVKSFQVDELIWKTILPVGS